MRDVAAILDAHDLGCDVGLAEAAMLKFVREQNCKTVRVLRGRRSTKCFERLGGRTRARTWDPLIKSQLLYQLSYAPGTGPEKAFARGVV